MPVLMPKLTPVLSSPYSSLMSKSMKLGGGGRFAKLRNQLSKEKGVTNPAALAAAIGRKKYGNPKMAKLAASKRNKG